MIEDFGERYHYEIFIGFVVVLILGSVILGASTGWHLAPWQDYR